MVLAEYNTSISSPSQELIDHLNDNLDDDQQISDVNINVLLDVLEKYGSTSINIS